MKTDYEKNLSNGRWITVDNIDSEIEGVLRIETWLAPRQGREPMITSEQVIVELEKGKELRYGAEWYENVRVKQRSKDFPVGNNWYKDHADNENIYDEERERRMSR